MQPPQKIHLRAVPATDEGNQQQGYSLLHRLVACQQLYLLSKYSPTTCSVAFKSMCGTGLLQRIFGVFRILLCSRLQQRSCCMMQTTPQAAGSRKRECPEETLHMLIYRTSHATDCRRLFLLRNARSHEGCVRCTNTSVRQASRSLRGMFLIFMILAHTSLRCCR